MTKSWKRLVAGGAVLLMGALGFGGCFGHGGGGCDMQTSSFSSEPCVPV